MSPRRALDWYLENLGPIVSDLLGAEPSPHLIKHFVAAPRDRDNEFDVRRLIGLLKVASP